MGNSICFFLKSLGGYVREKDIKDNRPMYDQLLAEVAKGNVVRLRNGIYALPDESYLFLGFIDIGSAIKVAGFDMKRYLLKKQNKLFWYEGKRLFTLKKCHFTQQNKLFCYHTRVVTLYKKASLCLTLLLSVS